MRDTLGRGSVRLQGELVTRLTGDAIRKYSESCLLGGSLSVASKCAINCLDSVEAARSRSAVLARSG